MIFWSYSTYWGINGFCDAKDHVFSTEQIGHQALLIKFKSLALHISETIHSWKMIPRNCRSFSLCWCPPWVFFHVFSTKAQRPSAAWEAILRVLYAYFMGKPREACVAGELCGRKRLYIYIYIYYIIHVEPNYNRNGMFRIESKCHQNIKVNNLRFLDIDYLPDNNILVVW